MKAIYLESFEKDLKKLKEKRIKKTLLDFIERLNEIKSSNEIKNLKKIKGTTYYFRVKMGDYRLGIKIESATVTFIRFLHRKEIYRYFPS